MKNPIVDCRRPITRPLSRSRLNASHAVSGTSSTWQAANSRNLALGRRSGPISMQQDRRNPTARWRRPDLHGCGDAEARLAAVRMGKPGRLEPLLDRALTGRSGVPPILFAWRWPERRPRARFLESCRLPRLLPRAGDGVRRVQPASRQGLVIGPFGNPTIGFFIEPRRLDDNSRSFLLYRRRPLRSRSNRPDSLPTGPTKTSCHYAGYEHGMGSWLSSTGKPVSLSYQIPIASTTCRPAGAEGSVRQPAA